MPPLAKKIAKIGLNRAIIRECLWASLLVSVALIAFTRLTGIPFVAANAGGLVAVAMLAVPRFLLPDDADDPSDYLLPLHRPLASLRTATVVLALIAIFYVPGIHVLRTSVFHEQPTFSLGALRRPQNALLGTPPATPDPASAALLSYHTAGTTTVRWNPGANGTLTISADEPILDVDHFRSTHSISSELTPDRSAEVQFRHQQAEHVTIELHTDGQTPQLTTPNGRVRDGEGESLEFDIHYSMLWMLTVALVQALVVALPEEAFFRGYLQRRLHEAGLRRVILRVPGLEVTTANLATSVLFALAHLPAALSPYRLATFFPSLLFGAMRDRDRSILSAIIVHTIGNMIMQIATGIYR
jgi:hypothetical protein